MKATISTGIFASIFVISFTAHAQLSDVVNTDQSLTISSAVTKEHRLTKKQTQQLDRLEKRFQCFGTLINSAVYSITVCGDLPDNDHPEVIHLKKEPGHVFIIFEKKDSFSNCSIAFGFYPRKPLASLFFTRVKSKILESHSREYEVSISKTVTAEQFQWLEEKAKEFSLKRYDLAHYNCYDYALEIFNSIPNIEKLPVSRVKYPFPFGSGGSPCCLYHDLKILRDQNNFWKNSIQFGHFKSAPNCKN